MEALPLTVLPGSVVSSQSEPSAQGIANAARSATVPALDGGLPTSASTAGIVEHAAELSLQGRTILRLRKGD